MLNFNHVNAHIVLLVGLDFCNGRLVVRVGLKVGR